MILLEPLGLRFACDGCKTGHRTSKCSHTNRPLKETRQMGRPATQCGHCRGNREKGKGHNHHKCLCGAGSFIRKQMTVDFSQEIKLIFDPERNDIAELEASIRDLDATSSLYIVVDSKKNTQLPIKKVNISILSISVSEETCEDTLMKILSNPCNCALGDTCICSSLSISQYKAASAVAASKAKNKEIKNESGCCGGDKKTHSCCAKIKTDISNENNKSAKKCCCG